MITVDFEDLTMEIEDGTLKHVGAPTAGATVKLYGVETATARAFGDSQVKVAFDDGAGNEVEVALDPDAAAGLADGLADLREEGDVVE